MVRGGFILRLVAMLLFIALSSFLLIATGFSIARGMPATRILGVSFAAAVSVALLTIITRIHLRATPLQPVPTPEDTLRNRAPNIGCGAIAFAMSGFGFVFAIAAIVSPATDRGAVIAGLLLGAFLALTALVAWLNAVRSYTGDDDIFSGARGTAVSIVIVAAVIIAGIWIRLGLDLDFWRGLIQGAFEASR